MKKVLIITYYWPPSGGAGVQRWLKFVKYLPEFGVQPIVITVDPNYGSYPQTDNSLQAEVSDKVKVYKTKSFEPYNLYKKVSGSGETPYGGFANEGNPSLIQKVSRFIRGNLFIPDPRKGWNKYAFAQACKIIESENIDAIITTSPPHSTQLIGRALKRKYNIKWIADMRDPWTKSYYYNALYPTFLARNIDLKFEHSVLLEADLILLVSEALKAQFLTLGDFDSAKFSVIPNGFDEKDFDVPIPAKTANVNYLTYAGSITDHYNVSGLLALMKLVKAKNPGNFRFRFIGVVSPSVQKQFEDNNLNSIIEYVAYMPHKQVIGYLLQTEILLLVLPDGEEDKGVVSGKIFEYLGAKRPILAFGHQYGDAKNLIETANAGALFANHQVNDAYQFLSDFAESKHQFSFSGTAQFTRKTLTKRFVALLDNPIQNK